MEITAEDIRAIQRKLDSLRKMNSTAKKPKPASAHSSKNRAANKLENDVFDSEKFFDID